MEILHEINPALEALAYLGSRANGHTLDRLEERLQARGVRKAEPFHRASAALRELLQDLDAEVSVPAETLQRLFSDIKGFSYSTIGSYSPAFLFFYPMLSRRQDFETLMQQMERLTPDETARNMMISLSLEEQSGPAAGAAAKLVSRVLALTIPTESRLALLEIHQNYRTLLPEIAACLRPAIAALETESGRIQEIIEAFCREVEGLGTESYLRETSSLAITPEVHYHLIPFLMGPDTNLSMEQEDGSVLICCGVMRLSLRRTLAENSSASQVYDAIRIIGDKTRFDILCYLRDHPAVYGQQLCNHFGLARNTIHHHMSKLVNAGLVTCLVEGNRIYYTTDREHLSYLLNQQRQLLIGGEDVEILIIDDGSTKDRTAEIADEYEAQFPTIVRAIHKENGGHGSAVNTGIANATGLYFKVVDSDDWVKQDAYFKILDTLRELAGGGQALDMLISNYVYEKEGERRKKVIQYRHILPVEKMFTWTDCHHFLKGHYILMHSVIFRTRLLQECGLKLPEHTFYVDNLYVFEPLPYVKNMYYLDVNFYRYYIGRQDQSVNETVMISRIDQQIRVTKLMIDYLVGRKSELVKNRRLYQYMRNYLEIIMAVSSVLLIRSGTTEHLEKKKELWEYLKGKDKRLYLWMRNGIMGGTMNLPGRGGRKISVEGYKICQKLFGFN